MVHKSSFWRFSRFSVTYTYTIIVLAEFCGFVNSSIVRSFISCNEKSNLRDIQSKSKTFCRAVWINFVGTSEKESKRCPNQKREHYTACGFFFWHVYAVHRCKWNFFELFWCNLLFCKLCFRFHSIHSFHSFESLPFSFPLFKQYVQLKPFSILEQTMQK